MTKSASTTAARSRSTMSPICCWRRISVASLSASFFRSTVRPRRRPARSRHRTSHLPLFFFGRRRHSCLLRAGLKRPQSGEASSLRLGRYTEERRRRQTRPPLRDPVLLDPRVDIGWPDPDTSAQPKGGQFAPVDGTKNGVVAEAGALCDLLRG